ncbi:unnamed protein product [Ceutorhynchus assimilis]|uniref:DUF4536 domain-containing protein n=1 Tax=Ceutorhynchus assimilis TaxID=467358 RepID=A0A9N9MMR3_9CUCU|nr:unnamed protein product [Ceutorhynchus assimilis]
MENSEKHMKNNVKKSCLSCKIIAILCFPSIGIYLIHTAKTYKPRARIFTTALGTGAILLGISEIFDKNPMRESTT